MTTSQGPDADSWCYLVKDEQLAFSCPAEGPPVPLAVLMHSQFRAMMLSPAFPCLGGAGAIRRGDYRFAVYPELGCDTSISECAADLTVFLRENPKEENPVAAFVAVFRGPVLSDDRHFETELWNHLKGLRKFDLAHSNKPMASACAGEQDDPGFFFIDREFFVVGLHPASSRWARRFAWPVLVFNALTHAQDLERRGKHAQLREKILARDKLLQGTENPSLPFSQYAQFSGRPVDSDWKCPFEPE